MVHYKFGAFLEERNKLYEEVWQEPMTTVAKKYGLSDVGLRKRCVKLQIPLPPAGYWAKRQAGKSVDDRPPLPPFKYGSGANTRSHRIVELIDFEIISPDELAQMDGLDFLTPESESGFSQWLAKISVPKKIDSYSSLIVEFQNEMDYRKSRDDAYWYRDAVSYSLKNRPYDKSKVEYRTNKPVLPISVSDKQMNRVCRIIDSMITLLKELDGKMYVGHENEDNGIIEVFGHSFAFHVSEIMVKRRSLLNDTGEAEKHRDFRPVYDQVPTGQLRFYFQEHFLYERSNVKPRFFVCEDSSDTVVEQKLKEIFTEMLRLANLNAVSRCLEKRERQERIEAEARRVKAEEQQIAIQKRKQVTELKRKQFKQKMIYHMNDWFSAQKLSRYADQLEASIDSMDDEETRELLRTYIGMVRAEAEIKDPLSQIIIDMRDLDSDD